MRLAFIKRKHYRRIINLHGLLVDCAKVRTRHCFAFEPEHLSFGDTARLMQYSHGLVAQNGAGMINGLFLQKGGIAVEVRPYGFDPDRDMMWPAYFQEMISGSHVFYFAIRTISMDDRGSNPWDLPAQTLRAIHHGVATPRDNESRSSGLRPRFDSGFNL